MTAIIVLSSQISETDVSIPIKLPQYSGINDSYTNIRFFLNGTKLYHWVEQPGLVWIKIPTLSEGITTIILEWGDFTELGDIKNTFLIGSDFSASNELNNWVQKRGSWTVSNGVLMITPTSDNNVIYHKTAVSGNVCVRALVRAEKGGSTSAHPGVAWHIDPSSGAFRHVYFRPHRYVFNPTYANIQPGTFDGSSLSTFSGLSGFYFSWDAWHVIEARISGSNVKLYGNGELWHSWTHQYDANLQYYGLCAHNSGIDKFKWFVVYKLLDPMPQIIDIQWPNGYPYWIEHDQNNNPTKVWVRVPYVSGQRKIKVTTSGNSPDGKATFEVFDDFNALDTKLWTTGGESGKYSITVSNSKLRFYVNDSDWAGAYIQSKRRLSSSNFTVEFLGMKDKETTAGPYGLSGGLTTDTPTLSTSYYSTPDTPLLMAMLRTHTSSGSLFIAIITYMFNTTSVYSITSVMSSLTNMWWRVSLTNNLSSQQATFYNLSTLQTYSKTFSNYQFTHPYPFVGFGDYASTYNAYVDWVLARKNLPSDLSVSVENKGSYYEVTISTNSTLEDVQIPIDPNLLGVTSVSYPLVFNTPLSLSNLCTYIELRGNNKVDKYITNIIFSSKLLNTARFTDFLKAFLTYTALNRYNTFTVIAGTAKHKYVVEFTGAPVSFQPPGQINYGSYVNLSGNISAQNLTDYKTSSIAWEVQPSEAQQFASFLSIRGEISPIQVVAFAIHKTSFKPDEVLLPSTFEKLEPEIADEVAEITMIPAIKETITLIDRYSIGGRKVTKTFKDRYNIYGPNDVAINLLNENGFSELFDKAETTILQDTNSFNIENIVSLVAQQLISQYDKIEPHEIKIYAVLTESGITQTAGESVYGFITAETSIQDTSATGQNNSEWQLVIVNNVGVKSAETTSFDGDAIGTNMANTMLILQNFMGTNNAQVILADANLSGAKHATVSEWLAQFFGAQNIQTIVNSTNGSGQITTQTILNNEAYIGGKAAAVIHLIYSLYNSNTAINVLEKYQFIYANVAQSILESYLTRSAITAQFTPSSLLVMPADKIIEVLSLWSVINFNKIIETPSEAQLVSIDQAQYVSTAEEYLFANVAQFPDPVVISRDKAVKHATDITITGDVNLDVIPYTTWCELTGEIKRIDYLDTYCVFGLVRNCERMPIMPKTIRATMMNRYKKFIVVLKDKEMRDIWTVVIRIPENIPIPTKDISKVVLKDHFKELVGMRRKHVLLNKPVWYIISRDEHRSFPPVYPFEEG